MLFAHDVFHHSPLYHLIGMLLYSVSLIVDRTYAWPAKCVVS